MRYRFWCFNKERFTDKLLVGVYRAIIGFRENTDAQLDAFLTDDRFGFIRRYKLAITVFGGRFAAKTTIDWFAHALTFAACAALISVSKSASLERKSSSNGMP